MTQTIEAPIGTADSSHRFGGPHDQVSTRWMSAGHRHPAGERCRRHTVELLAMCVAGLVPWIVVLALTLPSDYRVHQWRTSWVGFDVLLAAAMGLTAIFGWRRHRAVIVSALATAVLLICDAWFDVSLAFGTPGIWMSAVLAALVEVPLALFLIHRAYGLISTMPWPADAARSRAAGVSPGS
jgi:hypothetical protein